MNNYFEYWLLHAQTMMDRGLWTQDFLEKKIARKQARGEVCTIC